jgi:hypothetical protein
MVRALIWTWHFCQDSFALAEQVSLTLCSSSSSAHVIEVLYHAEHWHRRHSHYFQVHRARFHPNITSDNELSM